MASGSHGKSLETARRLLEETSPAEAEQLPSLPSGFYDAFVLKGIRVVQALQPGTLLCHFTNSGGFLHGGATASLVDLVASAAFTTAGLRTRGSPLEMNISYLDAAFADEEIDIEAKVLRAGKAVGVAVVELKKKSGKIIAQARYSKYLGAASSKL
ncbi:acyl-coenzyme A thioesterase 13-like [Panicum miliaceum]|uniref:Acyl-coenzyme A thioesterase 13-like n=1 Tax=Panicum miliaceum TaxID=4540 RepID=A0A3L6PRQ3_PANMI|nr:acyl-coenzyme A thioesterase 13-like [Panicum miliaceum]